MKEPLSTWGKPVTAKDPKPLSWTPIRRGKLYCSPACGRGCTFAEYDAATRKAGELCKKLGVQWEPRIHENLGWHYRAVAAGGLLVVHEHDGACNAAYCPSGDAVCMKSGMISEYHPDPKKGVAWVIERIREERDKYDEILETLRQFKPKGAK